MLKNIGTPDRVIRLIMGILLFIYSIWSGSWLAFILTVFVFFEVLTHWCIFYALIGKNTCPIDKNSKK